MKPLSKSMLKMQLSAIKVMERMARKQKGLLSLAQGIPYFPTPNHIVQKVFQALSSGEASYYTIPEGRKDLREEISKDIFSRSGRRFCPEREILVTSGAMAAIQATLLTLLDPGDEVIVLAPAYASYYGQIMTAKGVPVPLSCSEKEGLKEKIEKAVNYRTKAILLANPSNPTGVNLGEEELRQIVQIAVQEDLYLICDEVYRDFIWEGKHVSMASFPQLEDRLVLIYSFSKAFSMTGFRVGYLAAPAFLVEQIMKIHDNMVTCAPHPAQIAALEAIQGGQKELQTRLEILKKHRHQGIQLFSNLPYFEMEYSPMAGYYLFLKVLGGSINSFEFAKYLLQEAGVATVPGIAFGPQGEGYIRICYAVEWNRLEQAYFRIYQTLNRLSSWQPFLGSSKNSMGA
ncbi:MAG: pyridoxal phosphate-dependent aminotransferase [Planctomycetota bacterium]|nr:MAG: pyridoxal phosphate-dependent aminotransferase [Planctomycetota bacterium]